MVNEPPHPPRWPELLTRHSVQLTAASPAGRNEARAALWNVLHAAVFASLRAQAHRVPVASREDLEDIASAKSLEILSRAEEGSWTPVGRPAHEIAGFVARVARNGLIDLARRRGREVAPPEDEDAWRDRLGENAATREPAPDDLTAGNEFVGALVECVEALAPRARLVWFQRVFLEAASRDIAQRCGVNAAHVDVLVQRARLALRTCMVNKGHGEVDAPPGAFVALWPTMMRMGDGTRGQEDKRSDD